MSIPCQDSCGPLLPSVLVRKMFVDFSEFQWICVSGLTQNVFLLPLHILVFYYDYRNTQFDKQICLVCNLTLLCMCTNVSYTYV